MDSNNVPQSEQPSGTTLPKKEEEKASVNPFETASEPQAVLQTPVHPTPPETTPPSETESPSKATETVDDELLIEQDGDFFWILQKVIWSVVKVLVVAGLIGFLIWVIWNPNENPLTQKIDIKGKKEQIEKTVEKAKEALEKPFKKTGKEVPAVAELPPEEFILVEDDSALVMARWHEWIKKTRNFEQKEIVSQSLNWLERSESFFSFPMNQFFVGETQIQRADKVDQVLAEIRSLLEESNVLRRDMVGQIQEYNVKLSEEQTKLNSSAAELEKTLKDSREEYSDQILADKVQAQKNVTEYVSLLEVRHFLIRNMEQYDKALRVSYENIVANRQAIVQNIQVVGFPGDPTNRILTPTEWRSTQTPTPEK